MNLRKYHRIVSLLVAVPFGVVLVTGLMLMLRTQFEWIQPKPLKMEVIAGKPLMGLEDIYEASKVSMMEIDQVIFRPGKFHLSVRLKNGNELQIHPQTGEILKTAPRMTNFLIDLHQGSFFTSWGQFYIFLPSALGVLFLLVSGLMIYPWRRRRG